MIRTIFFNSLFAITCEYDYVERTFGVLIYCPRCGTFRQLDGMPRKPILK